EAAVGARGTCALAAPPLLGGKRWGGAAAFFPPPPGGGGGGRGGGGGGGGGGPRPGSICSRRFAPAACCPSPGPRYARTTLSRCRRERDRNECVVPVYKGRKTRDAHRFRNETRTQAAVSRPQVVLRHGRPA